ncbi:Methyltransferase-like protein 13 [Nymphaea thermarum]|nr:Methyltransferase-like protein 13 [Nymphaea thermarum]
MEEALKSRKEDERKKNGLSLPSSVKAYLDPDYWNAFQQSGLVFECGFLGSWTLDYAFDEGGRRSSFDILPRNKRFTAEDHYEWLKDYSHFQHIMSRHVKATDSVRIKLFKFALFFLSFCALSHLEQEGIHDLSCGSSQLCENLYKDGMTNITCIDLSAVAVEKMQKRLKEVGYNGIQVLEADMLDLPFSTESFDVVIDKGTMDVLFVDSGDPWNPSPSTVEKVIAMLKCVHRVLRQDGTYISISFGQPHFRRPLFEMEEFTWSIEWETFGDGFHYFFYTLKKISETLQYNAP